MKKIKVLVIAFIMVTSLCLNWYTGIRAHAQDSTYFGVILTTNTSDAVKINADKCNITGHIASNGSVIVNKNDYIDKVTHYSELSIPDFGILFYGDNTEKSTATELKYNTLDGKVIRVEEHLSNNDINITPADIFNKSENTLIYSNHGDITIDSEDFSFSGLVCAPEGTIFINGENITINGMLIAERIVITAKSFNIENDETATETFMSLGRQVKEVYDNTLDQLFELNTEISCLLQSNGNKSDIQNMINEYDELKGYAYDKLEMKPDNRVEELFRDSNNKGVLSTTQAPYPTLPGIETLYDVYWYTSYVYYNSKEYETRSIMVMGKVDNGGLLRVKQKPFILKGEIVNLNAANDFFNKIYQVIIPPAAGTATSTLFSNPSAGLIVKFALSKIYIGRTTKPQDFIIKGNESYSIDVGVNSRMKYIWVYDNDYNGWVLCNAVNNATYTIIHSSWTVDPITRDFVAGTIIEKLSTPGRISKGESDAVGYFVNHKSYYGKVPSVPLRNELPGITYRGDNGSATFKAYYAQYPIHLIY